MPVTLRLRIVQIKGPEHRINHDITVRCGSAFFRLSPRKSEWCVFELDSTNEDVIFQSIYKNSSCKCRDIDGRKRIDFQDGVSLLIEGYWVSHKIQTSLVQSQPQVVKENTGICVISFNPIKGSDDIESISPNEGDILVETHLPERSRKNSMKNPVEDEDGPVARALEWLRDSDMESNRLLTSTAAHTRIPYKPAKQCRLNWTPDLTAMDIHHNAPPSEARNALRGVDISLKLNKMFMIAPDL